MNSNYIDKGSLQISVITNNIALPLSDAVVSITEDGNGTILEELKTNSSGQTEIIELPTPPLEYSLIGYEQRPYATYGLTIKAPNHETVHIDGVQILPNSVALQNVSLTPDNSSNYHMHNLLIAPHSLWAEYPSKIVEDETKELPYPTGFVVLPEPVIPEYIVVHLGIPQDNTANNVWIPFKDYIKNVASSEIYSTWEEETIKANVLAIISFVLNRVYTEWYRGKGYDFTVTNSTAYDQAFFYGRNIFKEISIIVDDLFTTYVTKENINQPLFTQYCDGRRVQCKGLSQWGSQQLGQQGLNAINILKHYYGNNIYLDVAKEVSGVPRSYSGNVLQIGSTGNDVRTIQTQLNRISNNYPAISKVRVDSVFGSKLQNTVKQFQKIFHLPQTGIVDFATWYEISNVYVAVMKMS